PSVMSSIGRSGLFSPPRGIFILLLYCLCHQRRNCLFLLNSRIARCCISNISPASFFVRSSPPPPPPPPPPACGGGVFIIHTIPPGRTAAPAAAGAQAGAPSTAIPA